jgi:hypothetical protein
VKIGLRKKRLATVEDCDNHDRRNGCRVPS